MILERNRAKKYTDLSPAFSSKPFIFVNILFYFYTFTTILNTDLFVGQSWNETSNWFDFNLVGETALLLFSNILLATLLIFIAKRYYQVNLNKKVLLFCLIMLLGEIIASFSFPSVFTYTDEVYINAYGQNALYIYRLDTIDRINYFFSSINTVLYLYVILAVIPKIFVYKKQYFFIYYALIVFALFACIYSYFNEQEIYKQIIETQNWIQLNSFLGSKNLYGLVLFLGVISSILLSYYKKNDYILLISFFFFINIFLSNCRTALICSFLLLTFYLVFLIINYWKKQKVRSIIIFTFLFATILFSIITYYAPNNTLSNIFRQVLNKAITLIKSKDGGTFNSRFIMQKRLLKLLFLNPMFLIFGLGNIQFNYAFYFTADVYVVNFWQPHNAFFNALGEGGIIRFVLYMGLTIYLFHKLIKQIIIFRNLDAIIYLLLLFVFEIRGISEPEYFLSTSISSIIFSILILLPILSSGNEINQINTFKTRKRNISYGFVFFIIAPLFLNCGLLSSTWQVSLSLIIFSLSLYIIGFILNLKNNNTKKYLEINIFLFIFYFVIFNRLYQFDDTSLIIYIQACIFSLVTTFAYFYRFIENNYINEGFFLWSKIESRSNRIRNIKDDK